MYLNYVVATLLVAGLLGQSDAGFKLTAPKDENEWDFHFRGEDPIYGGTARIDAVNANVIGQGEMSNTTAWRFDAGSDYKAIQIDVRYAEGLNVSYQAKAYFNSVRTKDEMVAQLAHQVFKLILNTTKDGRTCRLKVRMQAHDIHPKLDVTYLGLIGRVIEDSVELRNEISSKLGVSLEEPLSGLISLQAEIFLHVHVNRDELCEKIQKSTPTDFPEPIFKI